MTDAVDVEEKKPPAVAWWYSHIADKTNPRARALRARLRRADTSIDILSHKEVHELARRLKIEPCDAPRLVRVVSVLAHLKCDDPHTSPGRAFGAFSRDGKSRERPNLSQLRFEAIIQERDPDVAIKKIIRALPIIDHKCSAKSLVDGAMWWNERTRKQWCFDYFQTFLPKSPEKD